MEVDISKPVMIQGFGVNLFAIEQIERMLARGEVAPDRKFYQPGMDAWLPLSDLARILGKPLNIPKSKFVVSRPPSSSPEHLPGNAAHAPDPSASSFRRVSSIKLAKGKGTLRFRTDLKSQD